MSLRLMATALTMGVAIAPAFAVDLVPHRAVYDLTFLSGGQGGVTAARGRIVFEIGGAACVGWTVTFRQVLEMTSEDKPARLTDMSSTTFETADGTTFRFVIDRRNDGSLGEKVEGRAIRKDGSVGVELKLPKPGDSSLPGNVVFPTEHTRKLIEAAIAGESVVQMPIYDGSDDGQKVYDTLAVIGKPIVGETLGDEAPLKDLAEGKVRRWPTRLSYFKQGAGGDQTPIYTLNFDMFENGISGNLVLDYGNLRLKGEMKRIELLKPASC